MKLTISTLCCPNWSFPQVVGAAAAHGIDGIDPRGIGPEIDITKLPIFETEWANTLALLRRHRLQMPCLNTSVTLVTPAPERWDMMLQECQRYAVLAGHLGSSFIRIFGGAVPKGMTRTEATAMARRHLRQITKVCLPHKCLPLVETHDAWSAADEVMELLAEFAADEAGVLWDVEHPCRRGEAPVHTAGVLSSHLKHVHFKDSMSVNGRSVPRLLGAGDLPLRDAIAALRRYNYDSWICLETEKRWHPQEAPEPEQSLPQFAQFMRENWR